MKSNSNQQQQAAAMGGDNFRDRAPSLPLVRASIDPLLKTLEEWDIGRLEQRQKDIIAKFTSIAQTPKVKNRKEKNDKVDKDEERIVKVLNLCSTAQTDNRNLITLVKDWRSLAIALRLYNISKARIYPQVPGFEKVAFNDLQFENHADDNTHAKLTFSPKNADLAKNLKILQGRSGGSGAERVAIQELIRTQQRLLDQIPELDKKITHSMGEAERLYLDIPLAPAIQAPASSAATKQRPVPPPKTEVKSNAQPAATSVASATATTSLEINIEISRLKDNIKMLKELAQKLNGVQATLGRATSLAQVEGHLTVINDVKLVMSQLSRLLFALELVEMSLGDENISQELATAEAIFYQGYDLFATKMSTFLESFPRFATAEVLSLPGVIDPNTAADVLLELIDSFSETAEVLSLPKIIDPEADALEELINSISEPQATALANEPIPASKPVSFIGAPVATISPVNGTEDIEDFMQNMMRDLADLDAMQCAAPATDVSSTISAPLPPAAVKPPIVAKKPTLSVQNGSVDGTNGSADSTPPVTVRARIAQFQNGLNSSAAVPAATGVRVTPPTRSMGPPRIAPRNGLTLAGAAAASASTQATSQAASANGAAPQPTNLQLTPH